MCASQLLGLMASSHWLLTDLESNSQIDLKLLSTNLPIGQHISDQFGQHVSAQNVTADNVYWAFNESDFATH